MLPRVSETLASSTSNVEEGARNTDARWPVQNICKRN